MTPKQIEKAFFDDINKIAAKYIIKLEKLPLKTESQIRKADNATGTVLSMIDQFHRLPSKIDKRFNAMEQKVQDAYDGLTLP